MRGRRIFGLREIILFFIGTTFLANGFAWGQMPYLSVHSFKYAGNGSRAMSMGGAFVAVANDASAIVWNPAGLAQLKSSEANITGRFNLASYSIQQPVSMLDTLLYKANATTQLLLNFVGFAFPFKIENKACVGGVAVRSISEPVPSIKWREDNLLTETEHIIKKEVHSGLYASSLAFGIQLLNQLSIGSTLNFITGRYEEKTTDVRLVNQSRTEIWRKSDHKYSGFSFDLGILYKPGTGIGIGINVASPYTLNITGIDSSDSRGLNKKLQDNIYYKLPLRTITGISFYPTNSITLAFEWRFNPWSNIEVNLADKKLDTHFTDGNSLHFGMEYLFKSEETTLPFRFGYARLQQHFREFDLVGQNGQGLQVIKSVYTCGFSFVTNPVSIELAFAYDKMDYPQDLEEIFGKSIVFNITQNSFRFSISMVYSF